MKKKIFPAIVIFIIAIIALSLFRLFPSYAHIIKSNWDISLPIKAVLTETYEKDSGDSFHGDGVRYHVFSYKHEDYIDLMFAWTPNEHKTNFYPTTREAAEVWLNEINVPLIERPDYASCVSWNKSKNDNSEIIFFGDNELNKIYIVENFI